MSSVQALLDNRRIEKVWIHQCPCRQWAYHPAESFDDGSDAECRLSFYTDYKSYMKVDVSGFFWKRNKWRSSIPFFFFFFFFLYTFYDPGSQFMTTCILASMWTPWEIEIFLLFYHDFLLFHRQFLYMNVLV